MAPIAASTCFDALSTALATEGQQLSDGLLFGLARCSSSLPENHNFGGSSRADLATSSMTTAGVACTAAVIAFRTQTRLVCVVAAARHSTKGSCAKVQGLHRDATMAFKLAHVELAALHAVIRTLRWADADGSELTQD
jgi:hypothetical protein